MDFLNSGIPLGRYFGIPVRLHITFFFYAWFLLRNAPDLVYGALIVVGLYVSILLHEFGHALAARWADGDAEGILLWPLGGLAHCRPAWHPTAHLICTAAGPFVTLVLWAGFTLLAWWLVPVLAHSVWGGFLSKMAQLNGWLLVFNLVPAFPMDGGRLLRDALWHGMNPLTATRIAVTVSRMVAVAVGLAVFSAPEMWGSWYDAGLPYPLAYAGLFCAENYWLLLFVAFVLLQTGREEAIVAAEASGTYGFSVRERLRRGRRQRAFRSAVASRTTMVEREGFHRCAECGRTEVTAPELEFRVCPDCAGGQEYCLAHLDNHQHR